MSDKVWFESYLNDEWLMSARFHKDSAQGALANAIENAREWGETGYLTVERGGLIVASYYVDSDDTPVDLTI